MCVRLGWWRPTTHTMYNFGRLGWSCGIHKTHTKPITLQVVNIAKIMIILLYGWCWKKNRQARNFFKKTLINMWVGSGESNTLGILGVVSAWGKENKIKSVNEEFPHKCHIRWHAIITHQNNLFIHKKAFACKQGERQYKICLLGFTWKLSPKNLKKIKFSQIFLLVHWPWTYRHAP